MKTWPTRKLEESFKQPSPQIKGIPKKQYKSAGDFPVIDQGVEFIAGYTDNERKVYKDRLPVVVFGDHTRIFKFVDFPFAPGADGAKILIPNKSFDPKFFYFALQSLNLENLGYSRHFKVLKLKKIPLPTIGEQKKIVEKIEKLFAKIDEASLLRAESLTASAALHPSALHQIFTTQQHPYKPENVGMFGSKKKWEEKELGEICELNPKKSEIKDKTDDFSVSFVPMSAVDEYSQAIVSLQERSLGEVRKGYTYFRNGDVLFAKITPCMENGKVAIAKNLKNGIGFGTTEFHVIRTSKEVLPEWIHYIIGQPSFREIAKTRMTGSAGQKRVPIQFLEKFKIPLPPIAEQKKIVEYLDSLSRKTRALQNLQSQTTADFSALRQSVLHQAFSIK